MNRISRINALLAKQIEKGLRSVELWAVAVPGGLGGFIAFELEIFFNHAAYIGPIVSIIFGMAAGLTVSILLINVERTDIPRLVILSFLAGLMWKPVINQGLTLITDEPIFLRDLAQVFDGQELSDLNHPNFWESISESQKKTLDRILEGLETGNPQDQNQDYLEDEIEQLFIRLTADHVTREEAVALLGAFLGPNSLREAHIQERAIANQFSLIYDLSTLSTLGLVELKDDIQDIQVTALGEQIYELLATPESNEIELVLDEAVRGEIVGLEVDLYKFVVETSGDYEFFTSSAPNGIDIDTVITLYRGEGDSRLKIGDDDDGAEGYFSSLVETLLPDTYYIEVTSFEGTESGEYELQVSPCCIDRSSNENPSETFAPPSQEEIRALDLGMQGVIGSLSEAEGGRWYRFNVDNSGEYIIATSMVDNTEFDTELRLFQRSAVNAGYDLIGYDDDGGEPSPYSSLSEYLEPLEDGSAKTYYIRVNGYYAEAGSFLVSVQKVD